MGCEVFIRFKAEVECFTGLKFYDSDVTMGEENMIIMNFVVFLLEMILPLSLPHYIPNIRMVIVKEEFALLLIWYDVCFIFFFFFLHH